MKSFLKSLLSVTTMATRLRMDQVSRVEIALWGIFYFSLLLHESMDLFSSPLNWEAVILWTLDIGYILAFYFLNTRLDGKHFFKRLFCLFVPVFSQIIFLMMFLCVIYEILSYQIELFIRIFLFVSENKSAFYALYITTLCVFSFFRTYQGFCLAAGLKKNKGIE